MPRQTRKKIALYTFGALSGAALSISVQSFAAGQKDENLPIQSLKTMAEVYGQIKANYVSTSEDSKLLENAIKGMVSGLDPHSEYMLCRYEGKHFRRVWRFGYGNRCGRRFCEGYCTD